MSPTLLIIFSIATGNVFETSRVNLFDTTTECHQWLAEKTVNHDGAVAFDDQYKLTAVVELDEATHYATCHPIADTTS